MIFMSNDNSTRPTDEIGAHEHSVDLVKNSSSSRSD